MSPFSDLWALLLSRALKESFSHWTGPIFSHHCPAVTPKKGASCWQCPVERGCVSYPAQRSVGASPCRGGFVIAALKGSTLSSPLGTACCFLSIAPARTLCPGPSKALLFPSVGSDLWNIFAEGKVIGKQDRTRKVVSHLVLKKILKFLISENRGNPCVLEVYRVMDTGGRNVIRILPADRREHGGILHPSSFSSNHNCRVCVKGTGFPSFSPLLI